MFCSKLVLTLLDCTRLEPAKFCSYPDNMHLTSIHSLSNRGIILSAELDLTSICMVRAGLEKPLNLMFVLKNP